MIRIYKSPARPTALDKGYNADEVCSQLLADQNHKCYLCERQRTTDYQVEHLKSQANSAELKQQWENLFLVCSYCNQKKSNGFDDILNPTLHNIEEIIVHSNDFSKKEVVFQPIHTPSPSVESTIRLLNRLFNGTSGLRNLREQQFYDEFIRKLNVFSKAVNEYLAGNREEYRSIIEEQLNIENEYLGFKYAIIHRNDSLKRDFSHLVIWNKQY